MTGPGEKQKLECKGWMNFIMDSRRTGDRQGPGAGEEFNLQAGTGTDLAALGWCLSYEGDHFQKVYGGNLCSTQVLGVWGPPRCTLSAPYEFPDRGFTTKLC